jgi:DNA-directed RNA polymerase subunit L
LRIENATDTIANLLRCALLELPGVEDAAFSRSHPTDDHFRIYVNARRRTTAGGGGGDSAGAVTDTDVPQTRIETLTLIIEAIAATLAKLQDLKAKYAALDAVSPTPFYSYKDD